MSFSVTGTVVSRGEGTVNPNLKTGKIEIHAEDVQIINEAKTPPFMIDDQNGSVGRCPVEIPLCGSSSPGHGWKRSKCAIMSRVIPQLLE